MNDGIPTVELVVLDAGGGHRAAANALQAAIREQRRPWVVNCTNLMSMLDPEDRFRRVTGRAPEDLYNLPLARGWTLGMGAQLRVLQAMLRLGHGLLVARLERHLRRQRPSIVVSLVPNFNRALGEAVARALPGAPLVTVMTDLADLPPHFWAEPGTDQHLVCGTERARQQALAQGVDPGRLHRVSGMMIHPQFYPPLAIDRAQERLQLGLPPDRPTGVVMFGGQGCDEMLRIERELHDVPLVLMCGRNRSLAQRLRRRSAGAPRAVVEFTPEVAKHLQLGDFFVGKPGPGCLSEAVQLGLPVVTISNARTMPQERFNAEWVLERRLGPVLRSWDELRPAVRQLLDRIDEHRAAVARVDNRAVFEVPAIIERLLRTQARPVERHRGPPLRVTPLLHPAAVVRESLGEG